MVSKKYLGDYRLENRRDPKTGKIKTVPEYCGEWFGFEHGADEVRRTKRLCLALTAAVEVLFLTVLLLNAPCGRIYYVMLPFAAMVFPAFFLAAGCLRVLTAGEKITREHRDKLSRRMNVCPAFLALLSALSLAGHVLYAVRTGLTAKDAISLAAAAGILACAAVLLKTRDGLSLKKVG